MHGTVSRNALSLESAAMDVLLPLIADYGLWFVFLAVLLDQGGIPVPAWPPIVLASAVAVEQGQPAWPIVVVAMVAGVLADLLWYAGGRRFGMRLIGMMCRLSLSPDSCVSTTRGIYARWGPPALIVAKFVPGFAAVATTLAGHTRTPIARFALFDGIGAALWAGFAVALGVLFHEAVGEVLLTIEAMGRAGGWLVLVALAAFIGWKWWKRRRFMRLVGMARITPAELHGLFQSGQRPLVVDVRPAAMREASGWIPGAILADRIAELAPGEQQEVVVYCDCPNEASAALVARQLKAHGFRRVRPLAGGFEAWHADGRPVAGGAPR